MKRDIRHRAVAPSLAIALSVVGLFTTGRMVSATAPTETPTETASQTAAQSAAPTAAPTTAESTGIVVGASGAVSPIVSDLEQALEFYHGLLGLKSDVPSTASAKDSPPPPILKLEGTPTARMRWSHVTFPGTQWWAEPLEFGDINRTPMPLRIQDPGAATLILLVRNVDDLLARLKQAGTRVITPGGAPVTLATGGTKNRAVLVAGPDGHLVELRQPDPLPTVDTSGDVIGGHIRIAVGNMDDTLRLYRDRLGFAPHSEAVTSDSAFASLTGLVKPQLRWATMTVPGDPRLSLEMIEVKGVERHPIAPQIVDPGATRLMFMVRDLNAAVAAFTATGGAVVSTDAKPVSLGRGGAYIVVRDLNNFFVILREQAPR